MTTTIACRTCHAQNDPSQSFCDRCGAMLPAPLAADTISAAVDRSPSQGEPAASLADVRCSGCRTVYPSDRTYCQRCGTWLTEPEEKAATKAALRVPVPPTTISPAVSPTLRSPQGRSSRRGLFAAVGIGMALGLAGLILGTTILGIGDSSTTPQTADAPAAAVDVADETPAPVDPTPEPVAPTDAPSEPEPTPVIAEATPVAIAVEEPEPAVTAEPTPALVLERVDREEVLSPRDLEPIEPAPEGRVNRLDTWICDGGDLRVEGPRGLWELDRVNFEIPSNDRERVVFHLERTGPGDDRPATLTAQSFHSDLVRKFAPRAVKPSAGRKTVGILLANGVRDDLNLRAFRPAGTRIVKEFSSYKAPGPSTRLVTSVGAPSCFRIQAPVWTGPNAGTAKRAKIILDIRR